jgi:hypothetical protein
VASSVSDPGTALGSALASLALLETSTDQVEIMGALLNQDETASGNLRDVIDVYWKLPDKPGIFTTRVPFVVNWLALVFVYIGEKQLQVRAIYDGVVNAAALPRIPIPPGSPVPGQPF